MSVLRPIPSAGGAVGAALRLTAAGVGLAAAPAVLAAGLVNPATRATGRALRGSVDLARGVAVQGARVAGTVITGSDPIPDGSPRGLVDVAKGMLEPPMARRTRRVWADSGHVHVELAAPPAEESAEVRSALRRQLERLEGVQWATVNDVVGRVLVAVDSRQVSVEDVVGVVAAVEQARGGTHVFPLREDHPADLEPFLAALLTAAIDTAAVGVAAVAKVLPVPGLTRHATLVTALLDSQRWLKDGLEARIGPIGTGLVFTGTSAFLHALTQSPTVPALHATVAYARVAEVRARRQVWRRREAELCRPEPEDAPGEPLTTLRRVAEQHELGPRALQVLTQGEQRVLLERP